jgi:hypothetical protein
MRQLSLYAAFAFAMTALACLPAAADTAAAATSDTALTGTISSMQYLIGSWNCSVKIAASEGQPAATDHGVLTYSVVPGNALHSHVTANDYAADQYIGYVDKSKLFWMNTIDAYRNLAGETSTDDKVFTGSSTGSQGKIQIRDTFTRPTSNTVRDLQEFQSNGAWHMASDSTCTRM